MRVTNQEELVEALHAGTTLLELEGDLAKLVSTAKASTQGALGYALGGAVGFAIGALLFPPLGVIGIGSGVLGGVVGAAVATRARRLIAEGKNGPELVKMLENYEAISRRDGTVLLQKRETP